jgi:hypothetical protein
LERELSLKATGLRSGPKNNRETPNHTHFGKRSGATMSDQQLPAEPAVGDQDDSDNQILEAFRRKSYFGVYHFLFDAWQAWMINTERRSIAPLCRIVIGDEDDGSVLIDKNVLITGLLHLADDLTSTVAFNIRRASELPGMVLDVPGGEPHVIELIDDIEGSLKEIRELIEKKKIFAAVDDGEDKQ